MQTQPYVVFARKYRPNNFTDLRGQQTLVQVLNSAISKTRLAHAYLLTGIRGVGKTTSARIIAKTINCTNKQLVDKLTIPCEKCDNCLAVQATNHPDIFEMDAASKTSVEDIRDIIEDAQYKPLLATYKVFIVDEIHMLSKNAFNAFLKLLEEPPFHVIFIFATTEVNKIPVTVLSRCQRFDLKRLSISELNNLLIDICRKENIIYDEQAINIIALKADGSARDAISMLDQAVSLIYMQQPQKKQSKKTIEKLTVEIVADMVGIIDMQLVINIVTAIVERDVKSAVKFLEEAHAVGIDLVMLTENILDFIASLTKAKTIKDYQSDIFANYSVDIKNLTERTNVTWLLIAWQILIKGLVEIKNSYNAFLSIEMLIVKIIHATMLPSPKELIEQLAEQNKEFIASGVSVERPELKISPRQAH